MAHNIQQIDYTQLHLVDKPDVVYKYRSWNGGSTNSDRTLTHNELYLSAPSDFDDPLDCKIPERYDLMNDEEKRKWIRRVLKNNHPNFNDIAIERDVEHYHKRTFNDDAKMEEFAKYEWESYNEKSGILSLCKDVNNLQMWECYGDHHKGICYGFHTDTLIESCEIGMGGDVIYDNELPIIHPLQDIIVKAALRVMYKLTKWEFEDEYRLRTFHESNAIAANRKKYYPPESLVEVTIGKNFDAQQEEQIKQELRNKGSIAVLYRSVENNDILTRQQIAY
ncbi:DUF2971 domain-containing protein [Pedobacter agri]|uniref:DUF2971 domain-containing protein n=1 Tax=Pedobacter agri TaxID=454586 RepID=A0A9X3DHY5_9SPHI|nr:DUF2971 domain-containing protein [Pedobacter agri]MCX3266460.1 DUF2971 domain-containing protein [Pedobacter agri]